MNAYVSNLDNLKHDIAVDLATLTSKVLESDFWYSHVFNFHCLLKIKDTPDLPLIVEGYIGNLCSFDEDDYGEILCHGIRLTDIVFKDIDYLCKASDQDLSAMFQLVSDVLQKDEYKELIISNQGKPFVRIND